MAENAHLAALYEERQRRLNTYDFALFVEDDTEKPLGYMACLEIDADSIWILHGGAFSSAKQTLRAATGFHLMVNYLRENYFRARLDTKNSNIAMIKLAYSAGFKIVGVEQQGLDLYLNMTNVFRDE